MEKLEERINEYLKQPHSDRELLEILIYAVEFSKVEIVKLILLGNKQVNKFKKITIWLLVISIINLLLFLVYMK